MIFAGGLVTYIYFTEITPPNYDAYYQRYVGSSFPRIVGILVLMAGLILFWGASIFLVYVNWRDNNSEPVPEPHNVEYYFDNNFPDRIQTPNLSAKTVRQPGRSSTTYIKENYIG